MRCRTISKSDRAGLTLYTSIAKAEVAVPGDGFLAFLTVPVMSQDQVDAISDGSWNESDPTGAESLSYIFDIGGFFSSAGSHPGGNRESAIEANLFDIGKTLDNEAVESHKDNSKIYRILRSGGTLVGILDDDTPSYGPDFSAITGTLAGNAMVNHVQSRPNNQNWQYYYVNFPFADA